MSYADDYDDTGDGYGDEHVERLDPLVRERISKDCQNGNHRMCVRRRTDDDGWCPCPCHDFTVAKPEEDPRYLKLLRAEIAHAWIDANSEGERRRANIVEALGHARTHIETLNKKLNDQEERNRQLVSQNVDRSGELRAMATALNQQVDRTLQLAAERDRIAARLEEFERMWRAPRTNPRRSARRVELEDDEQATSEGPKQASGSDAPGG